MNSIDHKVFTYRCELVKRAVERALNRNPEATANEIACVVGLTEIEVAAFLMFFRAAPHELVAAEKVATTISLNCQIGFLNRMLDALEDT